MNNYYNYDNTQINTNKFDPYVGFIRGNLFNELYAPYKNYKPAEINPLTEKDYLMTMIQIYGLALNDLDLYLDLHPNDNNLILLRTEYLNKYNEFKNSYELKYSALDLSSPTLTKSPWGWDSSFPWEVSK